MLTSAGIYREEQQPAGVCWSRIFELEWPREKAQVMRLGSELLDAADWTRDTIPRVAPFMPNALNGFDKVESTLRNFSQLDGVNMQVFMSSYDQVAEHCLQICSDLINANVAEPVIGTDDVEKTLEAVRAAKAEVEAAADLGGDLQAWLLDRLLEIERALLHHRVTGFAGVANSLDKAVGGLRRRPDLFARLNQSDSAQGVMSCLNLLLNVVTAATIFVAPSNQLPPAPPPTPVIQLGERVCPRFS
jgi:hypothetical protein